MFVKDLVKECKERSTKKECDNCPHKQKCDHLKMLMSEMSPSQYEKLMDIKI